MARKQKTTAASDASEAKFWVAFNRIPGVGTQRYKALLARFGNAVGGLAGHPHAS